MSISTARKKRRTHNRDCRSVHHTAPSSSVDSREGRRTGVLAHDLVTLPRSSGRTLYRNVTPLWSIETAARNIDSIAVPNTSRFCGAFWLV